MTPCVVKSGWHQVASKSRKPPFWIAHRSRRRKKGASRLWRRQEGERTEAAFAGWHAGPGPGCGGWSAVPRHRTPISRIGRAPGGFWRRPGGCCPGCAGYGPMEATPSRWWNGPSDMVAVRL